LFNYGLNTERDSNCTGNIGVWISATWLTCDNLQWYGVCSTKD